MKTTYVFIVALAVGAAGFLGGMQYQKSRTPSGFANFGSFRGQGTNSPQGMAAGGNRMMPARGGNRMTAGEVLSMDANTLTVKLPDGSSRIVILSEKTVYNKTQAGTLSDIKVGDNISVFGITNSDGSETAQSVQIGGMFRLGVTGTPANK